MKQVALGVVPSLDVLIEQVPAKGVFESMHVRKGGTFLPPSP